MSEAVKFLSEAGTFYLATIDGTIPKIRPFGIAVDYDEKIYFFTSNKKDVYKQLIENPAFEISATASDGNWIRIKGKAVFENNLDVKKKAFDVLPRLADIYQTHNNPSFVTFYISEGEASIYTHAGILKTFKV